MDDSLFRLAWALPLVLLIGIAAIYGLKRLGVGQAAAAAPGAETIVVVSEKSLSEHTHVFVLEHQRQQYLVFESRVSLSVQALPAAGSVASGPVPMGLQAWLRGRRVS